VSTLDRPNPTPAGVIRQADFFNDIRQQLTLALDPEADSLAHSENIGFRWILRVQ